jgi:phage tail sheath gpL-like
MVAATDFLQIPINIQTPGAYAEFDASRAVSGLPKPRNRTVIIGQRLNTGSVAAGVLTQVRFKDEAKAFFGRGSMLAGMIVSYLENDPDAELWAVALDDLVGGTAATRTITATGTTTEAGTIALQVLGEAVNVSVASGAAAATVATAIAAAINANADLAVTAAANAAVVTLTARHKGVAAGSIDSRDSYNVGEKLPAGLTLAHAAGTAGAGNPDVSTALSVIGDEPFMYIVHPYADSTNLGLIEAAIATRADALHMSDGIGITAQPGTFSAIQTAAAARNSEFTVLPGVRGLLNPVWAFVGALAGQMSASANADPGLPFTGLILKGIKAFAPADRWLRQERQYLIEAGASTVIVENGNVVIDRIVTTRKTNAQGYPDTAYQDANSLLVLYYLRWSMRNRIRSKFPRFKLGSDGGTYAPSARVVTPSAIRAELLGLFLEWEDAGLVENFEQFKAGLTVARDEANPNRVNALIPPDLINQFLIFAGQVQFRR